MGNIIAFIQFISKLIDLFNWAKDSLKTTPAEAVAQVHAVMAEVLKAKTVEEKVNAASKLQDLIAGS